MSVVELPEVPLPDLETLRTQALEFARDEEEDGCVPEDCIFLRVNLEIVRLIDEARSEVLEWWREDRTLGS